VGGPQFATKNKNANAPELSTTVNGNIAFLSRFSRGTLGRRWGSTLIGVPGAGRLLINAD
jgi:hypothetical protein